MTSNALGGQGPSTPHATATPGRQALALSARNRPHRRRSAPHATIRCGQARLPPSSPRAEPMSPCHLSHALSRRPPWGPSLVGVSPAARTFSSLRGGGASRQSHGPENSPRSSFLTGGGEPPRDDAMVSAALPQASATARNEMRRRRRSAPTRLNRSRRGGGRFAPTPAVPSSTSKLLPLSLQSERVQANPGTNRSVGPARGLRRPGSPGSRWRVGRRSWSRFDCES